jgi:hypothetical protein
MTSVFSSSAKLILGSWSRLLSLIMLGALSLGSSHSARALVITDNFSDLNDTANPAWTHLDGVLNSTGRTFDASTGQYFLHTNNDSTNPGVEGIGFLGSYVGTDFNDVRVAVDIPGWTPAELEQPTPANFGVAARLHGVHDLNADGDMLDANELNEQPSGDGLGLRGYFYGYEPFQGFPSPTGGEMVLYIFDGGGDTDVRSEKVHLDNTKTYRFVLEVVGPSLHGQVFNLTDGGVMVAEQFRDLSVEPISTDHDNNPVTPPVVHVPYADGFSGIIGIGSSIAGGEAQLTVDNFETQSLAAGDYNRNGVTDAADYVLWRNTLNETGPNGNPPTSFGNMAANGAYSVGYTQTIDAADYTFWRSHFGTTPTPGSGSGLGSGSVPEPSAAVLALLGLVTMFCRRGSW